MTRGLLKAPKRVAVVPPNRGVSSWAMPLDCTPYVPPASEAQVPRPAVPAESNSCVFERVYFPAPSDVMTPVRLHDSVRSPVVSLRKSTYRNRNCPLRLAFPLVSKL